MGAGKQTGHRRYTSQLGYRSVHEEQYVSADGGSRGNLQPPDSGHFGHGNHAGQAGYLRRRQHRDYSVINTNPKFAQPKLAALGLSSFKATNTWRRLSLQL